MLSNAYHTFVKFVALLIALVTFPFYCVGRALWEFCTMKNAIVWLSISGLFGISLYHKYEISTFGERYDQLRNRAGFNAYQAGTSIQLLAQRDKDFRGLEGITKQIYAENIELKKQVLILQEILQGLLGEELKQSTPSIKPDKDLET